MNTHRLVGLLMVLTLGLALVGCGSADTNDPIVTIPPVDENPPPNMPEWANSAHADGNAEAFTHWDDDGEIPTSCAKCHSTPGFQDFLGADGSTPGVVDQPAPIGTLVDCNACHNDAAEALDSVTFPSGQIATGLGGEARCMTCHQGRESTVSLNDHINGAMPTDDDAVTAGLSFKNIHYFAAGATLYGGSAMGAYQYTLPGDDGIIGTPDDEPKYGLYDTRNPHVAGQDTCIECHDPHSLQVRLDDCVTCHSVAVSVDLLKNIRMAGSVRDYDGDGDADEGIFHEIDTLATVLLDAIQQYGAGAVSMPIGYDAHAYPYFFNDSNGNGIIDPDEANFGNRYTSWTPRLLRAAYNYQYSQKDPGAFAHNPKYVIEFLYDSLADLNVNASVTVPNFANMYRNDSGHFDAGSEAFRHWDQDPDDIEDGSIDRGDVSASCARCHSPGGFDFWAEWSLDVTQPQPVGDGMRCEQCHVEGADFRTDPERKYIAFVDFPSGVTINNDPMAPDDSFLCMSCHKGRESGKTVDEKIASGSLSFRNIHYLPAGATLYGAEAEVGYQYRTGPGAMDPFKPYEPKFGHFGGNAAQCAYCHLEDHTFKPQLSAGCMGCHSEAGGDLERIRKNRATDYNGNLDNTEPLKDEIKTFGDRVLAAMQAWAVGQGLGGIVYDSHTYPYWFKDTNGDGIADPGEVNYGNQYRNWDAALLKASFNYQFWQKEPGAWAHNTHYILQLLYDSIDDLGGNLMGLTRP